MIFSLRCRKPLNYQGHIDQSRATERSSLPAIKRRIRLTGAEKARCLNAPQAGRVQRVSLTERSGFPQSLQVTKPRSGKRHPYYLCHTKGCASYGKSIRRDTLEGDFEALLKRLAPSARLFAIVKDMLGKAWNHRFSPSRSTPQGVTGGHAQGGKSNQSAAGAHC